MYVMGSLFFAMDFLRYGKNKWSLKWCAFIHTHTHTHTLHPRNLRGTSICEHLIVNVLGYRCEDTYKLQEWSVAVVTCHALDNWSWYGVHHSQTHFDSASSARVYQMSGTSVITALWSCRRGREIHIKTSVLEPYLTYQWLDQLTGI